MMEYKVFIFFLKMSHSVITVIFIEKKIENAIKSIINCHEYMKTFS